MLAAELDIPWLLIDRVANRIESEMGLSFVAQKRGDLVSAIKKIADLKGLDDCSCANWLLDGRWDAVKSDLCATHLTVPETYFFREPEAFDLVSDYARDRFTSAGGRSRPLRLWSAGCCTGEEAYSLALSLRYQVPEIDPGNISILATDLCKDHLLSARDGVYRQWSFRNDLVPQQNVNFREVAPSQYRIHDRIRQMVTFAELNLASPVYPSRITGTCDMDIIFCRNVLMYFSKAQARAAIGRFRQCLVDGGWLIVSAGEASADMFPGFHVVRHADAIYFQKSALSGCSSVEPGLGFQDLETIVPSSFSIPAQAVPLAAHKPEYPAAGLEPTVMRYYETALHAMEVGDRQEALRNLRRVIYLQPSFVLAHYLTGVLQVEHDPAQASKPLQAASELLARLGDNEPVPGGEGLSAAYLRGSVQAYLGEGG